MTSEEEQKFLMAVKAYVAASPYRLEKLLSVATHALIETAAENRSHAVDMETIAAMALNARLFKGQEVFIANKLEGWAHKNALRWDQQVAKLRKKVAQ
jgi:hypothetical protein